MPDSRRTSAPPKERLLDYVKNNNIDKLKKLVEENENVLNETYELRCNIIQTACLNFGNEIEEKTVKELLRLGVDIYYSHEEHEHMETLLMATLTLNPNILRPICEHIINNNPSKIDAMCDGNQSALLLLIYRGDYANKNYLDCAKLLLDAQINVNQVDVKNLTAIYWASYKGYKELVNLLLQERSDIDIDTHKRYNKSARDLIIEKGLCDKELPAGIKDNICLKTNCMMLLRLLEPQEFINCYNLFLDDNNVNYDDGFSNYLQMACRNDLSDCVQFLIEKGANINKVGTKDKQLPISIAARNGSYDILEMLLSDSRIEIPEDLLLCIQINNNENSKKCFELFWKTKSSSIDVNYRNEEGYTALHYATINDENDIMLKLLDAGASLGIRNNYGIMPIEMMHVDVIRKHFNNCINSDSIKKYIASFDYTNLIIYDEDTFSDVENVSSTKVITSETQVIEYLAGDKEKRSLLKHPLLSSFLFMKWYKLRRFYYVKLIFYIIFCTSLQLHICFNYFRGNDDQSLTLEIVSEMLSGILYVTLIIFIIMELFKLYVSPTAYIKNFENSAKVSLIILIIIMLSTNLQNEKQFIALIVLLSALELIMLIGQMPSLTTNIVILRTVSWNYSKCLAWYAILIVAFAFSFFILFLEDTNSKSTNTAENKETNISVEYPSLSVLKTIVMLTGQFDSDLDIFSYFPYTSRLIYIAFAFSIGIVLINLLNGLAVSDIQMIKSEAELLGLVARAKHVHFTEKMLLGKLFPSFSSNCSKSNYTLLKSLTGENMLVPDLINNKLSANLIKQGIVVNNSKSFSSHEIYLDRNTVERTRDVLESKKNEAEERYKEDRLEKIIREQVELRKLVTELNNRLKALDK